MTYLLLLFQQLIASTTHIVGKAVTTQIDPALVLLLRATTASVIFLAVMLFFKERRRRIEKKDILVFLLLGLINIPINQFLFLVSVKMTSPSNVALAYALTPAFVLIIAVLFLKERPKLINNIGIFTAIAGTVLVLSVEGFDLKSEQFIGNILALLASLSWAFYTILGKNITRKYGAIFSTTVAMVIGLTLFIPIFLFIPVKNSVFDISLIQWGEIIYLGAFTSVIGYVLWYMALKKIDASKISVFNNIQPIFTTILAIILFGYHLTGTFIIGGILIIIGVVLTQQKTKVLEEVETGK